MHTYNAYSHKRCKVHKEKVLGTQFIDYSNSNPHTACTLHITTEIEHKWIGMERVKLCMCVCYFGLAFFGGYVVIQRHLVYFTG